MTDEQMVAHAIGYLRGISAILWNLDGEKHNINFSESDAAYYDRQVDVLAHELFGKKGGDD